MNRISSFRGRGRGRGLGRVVSHTSARLGLVAVLFGYALSGQGAPNRTDTERKTAAEAAAARNALCTSISQFYWEIGDANGMKAKGIGGQALYGAAPSAAGSTPFPIYSAGKWIWGAYIYEKLGDKLSEMTPEGEAQRQFVTMTAGYGGLYEGDKSGASSFNQCIGSSTVQSCRDALYVPTEAYKNSRKDRFYYDSAHFQNQAVVAPYLLGTKELASKPNAPSLAEEVSGVLGVGGAFNLAYGSPHLAGGAQNTIPGYADFLRKILNKQLLGRVGLDGRDGLGAHAVCTYTGSAAYGYGVPSDATTGRKQCANAIYSPANDSTTTLNEEWQYSIGHWVEKDPINNVVKTAGKPDFYDYAFSSAGAAGFYPWIDMDRQYYGILARNITLSASSGQSVKCGRKIRQAWLLGAADPITGEPKAP